MLPAFYERLRDELTFPLSWERSTARDCRLDIPDVASLAAPKPALFHAGGRDHLFPPAGVETAYAKLRAVWESQGAGDRLITKVWPDTGHAFTSAMQDEVYAWLDTWLARNPTRPRGNRPTAS